MPARRTGALVAPVLLASLLWSAAPSAATASTEAAHCKSEGVGADSVCVVGGLRLHYVDWGGSGSTIVLLAGLGDSARIFDDLAVLLNRQHRVIAVTRRGYGRSSTPGGGDYSNPALTGDVLGVLDGLGIGRASFVGHSIAGGELAALGEHHPDRVERLVYIDAAYDRSQVPELMAHMPPLPAPPADVRSDFERLAKWRESALGVESAAVARNLVETVTRGDQGWLPRTAPEVGEKVLAGDIAAKARWNAIRAPSLALYSSKDLADQVPPDAPENLKEAVRAYSIRELRPWMLREQANFIELSPCAAAIEVPHSTHYLFLERPAWVAATILSFLDAADPCHWQAD
jgi:pimeloyl-ACP methyl ester carboxylesterase